MKNDDLAIGEHVLLHGEEVVTVLGYDDASRDRVIVAHLDGTVVVVGAVDIHRA